MDGGVGGVLYLRSGRSGPFDFSGTPNITQPPPSLRDAAQLVMRELQRQGHAGGAVAGDAIYATGDYGYITGWATTSSTATVLQPWTVQYAYADSGYRYVYDVRNGGDVGIENEDDVVVNFAGTPQAIPAPHTWWRNPAVARPVLTPEQEAEVRRRQEQAQAEERRRAEAWARRTADWEAVYGRERRRADVRARMLFRRYLTAHQRSEARQHGTIMERGPSGHRYRVSLQDPAGNIEVLNEAGSLIARLCVFPRGVPRHDAFLAQLMAIRHDEADLLARANIVGHTPNAPLVIRDGAYRLALPGAA